MRTALPLTAIVLLSMCACTWSGAQEEPLTIYHLSAKPVLQESGQAWDIQVRFVTSAPAVTRLDWGDTQACGNEALPTVRWDVTPDEPMRNHRFDLTDLPLGAKRYVRVRATAPDGREATSDVVEVAAPGPFPAGDVKRQVIPLTVAD
ncbi:MAG TPA: hypothetical protein VM283_08200, partial [Armatimonadota bacterium]|nr:hypothetical protein [Armatimonadota bacterium]